MAAVCVSKPAPSTSPMATGLSSLRVWKILQLKVPDLDTFSDCKFCAALTRGKELHCRYCHVTFVRPKAQFLQHQVILCCRERRFLCW